MSVQQTIIEKLQAEFSPILLQVENESHRHSSGRGAESHFKVVIVSEKFEPMSRIARHRAVYRCLTEELENGVHALAIHTYTAAEWEDLGQIAPKSTNCVGHGQ